MSEEDPSFLKGKSYGGRRFQPANDRELRQVIQMAFDYRGDVTLRLKSGLEKTGYVFARQEGTPKPFLRMFLENISDAQVVAYEEILEVIFSGEDTAFGKSWEEWSKKWGKHPSGKNDEKTELERPE